MYHTLTRFTHNNYKIGYTQVQSTHSLKGNKSLRSLVEGKKKQAPRYTLHFKDEDECSSL